VFNTNVPEQDSTEYLEEEIKDLKNKNKALENENFLLKNKIMNIESSCLGKFWNDYK
jgi:predicted RNase H-like nuclease (RuvC/YqgF family)